MPPRTTGPAAAQAGAPRHDSRAAREGPAQAALGAAAAHPAAGDQGGAAGMSADVPVPWSTDAVSCHQQVPGKRRLMLSHVRAARPVPCPRRAGWPTRWATRWSSLPQPLIDLQGSKHAAIGEHEEGRAFRSAAAAAAVVAKPAAAAPDARGSGSKTRACANSAGLAASAHRLRRVGPSLPCSVLAAAIAAVPRTSLLCPSNSRSSACRRATSRSAISAAFCRLQAGW